MAVAMPITAAAELCRKAGLKVVETGIEHGTVTVVGDGEAIEVTQTGSILILTGGMPPLPSAMTGRPMLSAAISR